MTDTGPAPDAVFPAGVASFDPTEDAVLIWAACRSGAVCSWEMATDDAFVEVVATGVAERTDDSPTVTVDVTGLESGRTHWYRFAADGVTSPVGRTRTLPDGSPTRVRIGVTCCARFGQAPFDVYGEMAAEDLDVVVHLGDYIYEDTKSEIPGREPVPDRDCVTLQDYRDRHLQCRQDPDLRRLHERHPMVAIWDDHDIADNASRGGATNHDDAGQGPWAARLGAALQAHDEFLPKRLADPADPTSAWRRLDAGALVALVCTETRAHRDVQAGVEGAPAAGDPARTMLGPVQADWLESAVEDPAPRWTIVLSGTVVSELRIDAPDALDGALPEKYTVEDGRAENSDQWDGYEADRRRLTAAARRRGGRTIVLSGDIHSSWAIEGPSDDGGPVAVEFTCPPAATTPLGQLLPPGAGGLLATTVTERLDQVRWMSCEHRGYQVLDVSADLVQVSYWWVGRHDGGVSVRLGRRWEVPGTGEIGRLVDPETVAHHERSIRSERGRPARALLAGAAGACTGAVVAVAAAVARAAGRLRRS